MRTSAGSNFSRSATSMDGQERVVHRLNVPDSKAADIGSNPNVGNVERGHRLAACRYPSPTSRARSARSRRGRAAAPFVAASVGGSLVFLGWVGIPVALLIVTLSLLILVWGESGEQSQQLRDKNEELETVCRGAGRPQSGERGPPRGGRAPEASDRQPATRVAELPLRGRPAARAGEARQKAPPDEGRRQFRVAGRPSRSGPHGDAPIGPRRGRGVARWRAGGGR